MSSRDEVRFLRLYEAHSHDIYAYFTRRTDVSSAQECTADTLLIAWRRLETIPWDRELPWLYGVARRVLANRRRSLKRAGRLIDKLAGVGADPGPTPETIVVRREEDEELLAAVSRLRPQDQELLRLTTWEELPRDEIAALLGCSRHAVDQRLYRATKRLARELAHAGHQHVEQPTLRPTERGETR